jgi:hypothetical protein
MAAPALLLLVLAVPARAADPEGRVFEVENASSVRIACRATIAHWFAADLGDAAPGGTVTFTAGIEADGTVFLTNARGERMPVETAFCGRLGHTWETRSQLDLRALSRDVPPGDAARAVCADAADGRLSCRRQPIGPEPAGLP